MIAETSFTTPKDIPEFSKFTHVIPKVDTANSSKAVVDKNGIVTTKTDPKSFQDFSYYPVFGCDSLKDG
jgi:hypothetical protein